MSFMSKFKSALKQDLERTRLALEEAIEKGADHPMLHDRDVMNRKFGQDELMDVLINTSASRK